MMIQRRTLTIMLNDIAGFTAKTSRMSREELMELLRMQDELIRPVIHHFGGRVVRTIGDAFMSVFDSPTDALLCAIRTQHELMVFNQNQEQEKQIHIRIALNVGEVQISGENDVFGEAVNTVSLLEKETPVDEVFFTERVFLSMNRNEVPGVQWVNRTRLDGTDDDISIYKIIPDPTDACYQQIIAAPLSPKAPVTGDSPAVETKDVSSSKTFHAFPNSLKISIAGLLLLFLLGFWLLQPNGPIHKKGRFNPFSSDGAASGQISSNLVPEDEPIRYSAIANTLEDLNSRLSGYQNQFRESEVGISAIQSRMSALSELHDFAQTEEDLQALEARFPSTLELMAALRESETASISIDQLLQPLGQSLKTTQNEASLPSHAAVFERWKALQLVASNLRKSTSNMIPALEKLQETHAAMRARLLEGRALRIERARGDLIVSSIPVGASASFGTEEVLTPGILRQLPAEQKIKVLFRLLHHEDHVEELSLKEGIQNRIPPVTLHRSVGTMTLHTEPSKTRYHLQAIFDPTISRTGITPAVESALPCGEYEVLFEKERWPSLKRKTVVSRNESTAVTGTFVPGSVRFESSPPGASVSQFDETNLSHVVGITPCNLENLLPGTYRFLLVKPGFATQEKTVTIEHGSDSLVRVTLRPWSGAMVGAPYQLEIDEHTRLDLDFIPAGRFVMGSPVGEAGRDDDEVQREITLSKHFWMGRTEVTQAQWQAVMRTSPSYFSNAGWEAPVESISWDEAMAFCEIVTEMEKTKGLLPEGYAYRLPTEAQWEYAARAGTPSATYAGDLRILGVNNAPALDAIAWYGGNSKVEYIGAIRSSHWKETQIQRVQSGTNPVGLKQANSWGLRDMIGNVSEWCFDWYHNDITTHTNLIDPIGPGKGVDKVVRGGSWMDTAARSRAAFRSYHAKDTKRNDVGFRITLSPVKD